MQNIRESGSLLKVVDSYLLNLRIYIRQMTAIPLFFLPYYTRDVGSKKDPNATVSYPNATVSLVGFAPPPDALGQ